MRGLSQARWVAGAAVLALTVTACGGDDTTDEGSGVPEATSGGESGEVTQGGVLRTQVGEPASLVPGNAGESAGSEVLGTLFSALVDYEKDGSIVPLVAAEIPTSDDLINWTITINEGWTFHDRTPVTAQSFVDAWNFAAYAPNAQSLGYFFGPGIASVEGFDALQSADPDGEGPEVAPEPAAKEMTGLEVVDETTFNVTLTEPLSLFPLMLGYTAFYPMPESCLTAEDFCNEAPVGNGPFMMDGVWNHDQGIAVTKYEDWGGETPPNIDGVEWTIYSDPQTAYLDLQDGNLDFLGDLPPEELANAETEFADRYIEEPSSTFQYIGFPLYDEKFGGGTIDDNYGGEAKVNLRKALSMAINRQELIDTIFNGSNTPADSLVSPIVDGYREGACGDACIFDVEAAKAMYDESGGIEGPIKLYFNGPDTPHAEWMTAVGNYWQAAFGLEYELNELPWAEYLEAQDAHEFDGVFRLGWIFDYPSPQSYLSPIYGPGAGELNFGYVDPEVDTLLQEGNASATIEEGIALYNEAEDKILETFPNIPMWFSQSIAAYNDTAENVELDLFGVVDYMKISMTSTS